MTVNSHHLLQLTHNKYCNIPLYCDHNDNDHEPPSPAVDDTQQML